MLYLQQKAILENMLLMDDFNFGSINLSINSIQKPVNFPGEMVDLKNSFEETFIKMKFKHKKYSFIEIEELSMIIGLIVRIILEIFIIFKKNKKNKRVMV